MRIISAVNTIDCVCDWMSNTVLKGRRCDIIVTNLHATMEDKNDNSQDSMYEKLQQVLNQFPEYHMQILSGDIHAKLGTEDIFNLTMGTRVSMKTVKIMVYSSKFLPHTHKNTTVKCTMFPQYNIHEYTLTSPDGKTQVTMITSW